MLYSSYQNETSDTGELHSPPVDVKRLKRTVTTDTKCIRWMSQLGEFWKLAHILHPVSSITSPVVCQHIRSISVGLIRVERTNTSKDNYTLWQSTPLLQLTGVIRWRESSWTRPCKTLQFNVKGLMEILAHWRLQCDAVSHLMLAQIFCDGTFAVICPSLIFNISWFILPWRLVSGFYAKIQDPLFYFWMDEWHAYFDPQASAVGCKQTIIPPTTPSMTLFCRF